MSRPLLRNLKIFHSKILSMDGVLGDHYSGYKGAICES